MRYDGLPYRGNARPPGRLRVNWQSPLSEGLLVACPFAGHYLDIARGVRITPAAGVTWAMQAPNGLHVSASVTGISDAPANALPQASYPVTVSAWTRPRTGNNGSFRSAFGWRPVNDNNGLGVGWSGTTGLPTIACSSGVQVVGSALTLNSQFYHVVGLFLSNTNRAIYVNGRLIASDSTNMAVPTATSFGFGNGSAAFLDVLAGAIWTRGLSEAEIRTLADPRTGWDLYVPA